MGTPLRLERFDRPHPAPQDGAAEPAMVAAQDGAAPEPAPLPAQPPAPTPAPEAATDGADRLAAALEGLDAAGEPLRRAAFDHARTVCLDAVRGALPTVLAAGFAAAVVEAIDALTAAGPCAGLELRLSETDHDLMVEALAGRRPPLPARIGLRLDPALGAGQTRLVWRDGGARIDAEALAAAALDRLAEDMPSAHPEQETAA